jgi:hypothetical protein
MKVNKSDAWAIGAVVTAVVGLAWFSLTGEMTSTQVLWLAAVFAVSCLGVLIFGKKG